MTPIRACLSCGTCNTHYLCTRCLWRTALAALALLACFLLAVLIPGCGSVELASQVSQMEGEHDANQVVTDSSIEVKLMETSTEDTSIDERYYDIGAFPICPPAITHPDCPQPKCDCQDR
jgi:hypothetical protein